MLIESNTKQRNLPNVAPIHLAGGAEGGSDAADGSVAGRLARMVAASAWTREECCCQPPASGGGAVVEPSVTFADLLRKLRREARLTQEELAEAAALSVRAVSYLETGEVTSPQKDTVRLLADALGLIGPARARFEAAGRGRTGPGGVAAATRTL